MRYLIWPDYSSWDAEENGEYPQWKSDDFFEVTDDTTVGELVAHFGWKGAKDIITLIHDEYTS